MHRKHFHWIFDNLSTLVAVIVQWKKKYTTKKNENPCFAWVLQMCLLSANKYLKNYWCVVHEPNVGRFSLHLHFARLYKKRWKKQYTKHFFFIKVKVIEEFSRCIDTSRRQNCGLIEWSKRILNLVLFYLLKKPKSSSCVLCIFCVLFLSS